MNVAVRKPQVGYEEDEQAWLLEQAAALHDGRVSDLDREHLGEYLTDMARRDRQELTSRLVVLQMHIIKCHMQSHKISGSWVSTILEQQRAINDILRHNPSLWNFARDEVLTCFPSAHRQAIADMGMRWENRLPLDPSYDLDTVLGAEFEPALHPSAPRRKVLRYIVGKPPSEPDQE